MSTPSSPRILRLSERSSSLADPQYDRSPPLQRSPRSAAATSPGAQAQSPGLVQSPSRSRPPPALALGRDHGPSTAGPSFARSPSMPLTDLARLQLPPGASQPATSPSSHGPRLSISNSSDGRVSLDSYYLAASPSYYQTTHTTQGPLPIPQTPDPPDPYSFDRRGLIGVGELATPRWTSTTGYRHMRSPSQSAISHADVGLGIRQESSAALLSTSTSTSSVITQLSPRTSPKAIARQTRPRPEIDTPSIGSLGSFGDLDFVAGIQDALASVSGPTPPPPRVPSKSPRHTHRTPPPPEENVIYVPPSRRSKTSPPNSADSTKRRSEIRTPGSPHHDVLKHFASKDFSHLPPSPSSASINQFLRGSGSVNNFAAVGAGASSGSPSHAPQGATGGYPFPSRSAAAPPLRGANSGSHLRQAMDSETAEALRKLDGLSARAKSKEKTPPPPPPPEKRTSSSTASSQSANPLTPSSVGPPKRRGSDTSSIVSDLAASIGDLEKEGTGTVPPVPPLPKDFQSLRSSVAQPLVPSANANPIDPLSSPEISESSSPIGTVKRPMNKKWSFSSALNLNFNSTTPLASPEALLSPQAWTHVDLPSPNEQQQQAQRPTPTRTETSSSIATVAPKLSPVPPANNKRLTQSSIPFFRRSSSSMTGSKLSAPTTSAPPIAPGEITPATRKSVLGIGIPSMLKGSGSRRNLSAQLDAAAPIETPLKSAPIEDPRKSSLGWTGRRRGKTLSKAAADLPAKPAGPPVSNASSRLRASLTVAPADGSVPRTGLPSITASPTKPPASASVRPTDSYRGLPSTTPTKIPRIVSRNVAPSPAVQGSMLPPAVPAHASARSATIGSSLYRTVTGANDSANNGVVNEFGVVNGTSAVPSQTTTRMRPVQTPPREDRQYYVDVSGTVTPRRGSSQNMPPSRRALPQPPSSAAGATGSIPVKKASRELPASRRASAAPLNNGETSPIKPSRSLHTKLSIPTAGRVPASTSSPMFGTPSSTIRQSIMSSRSPTSSPFEDEETLGDNEMAAYVKRRKARKPSSSKPDDMSDLTDFPEPASPAEATTPRSFIQQHFASLSDYERQEILDFSEIYYAGIKSDKNAARTDVAQNNFGYDDERGDYLIVPHDHLAYRYEVIGVLGKGSFGQVIQCRDHKTGESVAVKIIRNKKRFHHQALVEVKILKQLVEWDPEDKHYLVRMTENFYFRGHLCIVTELLSINLYELIKANSFVGFSTVLIRRFTTQMLASLQLMRSHRIVHCDLKPENILLRHPAKSGIKVIDFGSSCLETEKVYTYIQSRFYRSPEVILGMNYHMAIDMWSLGCILAELYTGFPIFPGENENEQLACIMEVMGLPDRYLLDRATRKKQFFDATGAPRPFVNAKGKRRRPATKTLAQVLKCDDELFLDFIAKCLVWDPERRLKPQAALRHPWILAGRRRQQVAASPASARIMISSPAAQSARLPHSTRHTLQAVGTTVGP